MKFIAFIIALFFSQIILGQPPSDVIWGKTADIKDKSGNVIAKMTIIPMLKREIFLKSSRQFKDSAGFYVYEFEFMKPNHVEANSVALVFNFNPHCENVYFDTKGTGKNIETKVSESGNNASYFASSLDADTIVLVKIISKKRVIPNISGISGQLIE